MRGLLGGAGGCVARDGRRTTLAPDADIEARRPVRDIDGILVGPSALDEIGADVDGVEDISDTFGSKM